MRDEIKTPDDAIAKLCQQCEVMRKLITDLTAQNAAVKARAETAEAEIEILREMAKAACEDAANEIKARNAAEAALASLRAILKSSAISPRYKLGYEHQSAPTGMYCKLCSRETWTQKPEDITHAADCMLKDIPHG